MLFHEIHGANVILRSKGVWRQAPVFQRGITPGAPLFAKWGGGFIALKPQHGTSVPHVLWDYIDGVPYTEQKGYNGQVVMK